MDDPVIVTHEILAERIDGIRTLLNRAIGIGVAIALATGAGAVGVYARTEVHTAAIHKLDPIPERLAAVEVSAAKKEDVTRDLTAVQTGIFARMDALTADLRSLSDRLARREGNGQ